MAWRAARVLGLSVIFVAITGKPTQAAELPYYEVEQNCVASAARIDGSEAMLNAFLRIEQESYDTL